MAGRREDAHVLPHLLKCIAHQTVRANAVVVSVVGTLDATALLERDARALLLAAGGGRQVAAAGYGKAWSRDDAEISCHDQTRDAPEAHLCAALHFTCAGPTSTAGSTRNAGAAKALAVLPDCEVLLFMDGDDVVSATYAEEALAAVAPVHHAGLPCVALHRVLRNAWGIDEMLRRTRRRHGARVARPPRATSLYVSSASESLARRAREALVSESVSRVHGARSAAERARAVAKHGPGGRRLRVYTSPDGGEKVATAEEMLEKLELACGHATVSRLAWDMVRYREGEPALGEDWDYVVEVWKRGVLIGMPSATSVYLRWKFADEAQRREMEDKVVEHAASHAST